MHFKIKQLNNILANLQKQALIVITTSLFLFCSMNGYNDLGELVNQFSQFGSDVASYMRTLYVEDGSVIEVITLNDHHNKKGQCSFMNVSVNEQKVIVTLQMGTYEILDDQLHVYYNIKYTNSYNSKSNPANVPGAEQHDYTPKEHFQMGWEQDAAAGTIQVGGARYKEIDRIFDNIFSQNSPDWIDQFIKMYLLNTMSAHTRIEGFGGGGMFQYLDKTTVFDALCFGTLNFSVTGLLAVNSRFTYKNHGELSGVILNGTMTNRSDMNGNGEMGGTIFFEIHGTKEVWHGSIDYSHLEITNTLPCDGEYLIHFEGVDYTVSYDYGNPGNFDLTDILDPDPANW